LPPGLAAAPDTRALLKALARRWFLALSLGLVCAAGAALAAWSLLSPRYTAFAEVRVAAQRDQILDGENNGPDGKDTFDTFKRLQAAEMKSRYVLNDALKKEEIKRLAIVQEQAEPIPWLEDELKVETKEGQEIITMTMTGDDPTEVLTLVRGVFESYMTEVVKKEQDDRRARILKLQKNFNDTREKLHHERDTLRERMVQAGGDPETLRDKKTVLITSLSEVKRQHQQIELELLQAKSRLAAHKALRKSRGKVRVPTALVHQALEADPHAKQFLMRMAQVQSFIQEYEQEARDPNEATLVKARGLLSRLKRQIRSRQAKVTKELKVVLQNKAQEDYDAMRKQLETAIVPLEQQERILRKRSTELAEKASRVTPTVNGIDLLQDDIKQDEKMVADLGEKINRLEVEAQSRPRVTPYQMADLQKVDIKRRVIAVILAPVAALVCVGFGVGWWEFRARRIQTAEEVATGLGMRVVGAIPTLSGPSLGRLVCTAEGFDGSESGLLESIDAIRTTLLRDPHAEQARVILVTSAVSGEGKTTVASNLATSLARAGRKTLFVDCDLRCPSAHQLFEQTLQPGLSEILLGEVHLVDAIRPTTAVAGLWLIPAGHWDREVLHALARQGVQEIFNRLREDFDFIVVDSHPVLPATDTMLIGQYADAVILSLMRDVSQMPRVHAAAQRLTNVGIRVLGAVVNGIPGEEYDTRYVYPAHAA
jgi:capsular exopolysaccharide synthesis family protein